ncbi:hypothetical protein RNF94_004443, partial [Salmonella enterica subsp. enterica serovar London]|nr:hypothetical protein [Salmonella enterica subsp. enterica serovar Uganda]EJS4973212.1 hypothetical protein [Salmonella enterica subsp. enterica serovar London]ELF4354203.1 hypothetical protein [Salmonella enterica subsp. enterica serovar London]
KRKIDGDFKKHKVIFFIPQKMNIPCNEFQDLGEEGKRRTRSVFSLNNINVSILLEDKYTRICLDSDDDFSYLYAKSILDSLSVASGVLLNPALVLWQGNDSRLLIFKHIDNKEKQRLMPFIPQRAPYYLNEWVQFSQAYIKKFETDKTFYYYWRKIFNAHQSDLENETLSLTVSIEGVINKFYSTFKIEDVEFSSLCCESKPVIENLEINERVKSSIIQLLEKGGRSSVKGTLFNMAKKGFFPEELATTWYKARNRSAHAKHFKEHSWQENVKNYNSCLTLFYMLLCYHIEYKGKFVHHHLPGAPLKNLTE